MPSSNSHSLLALRSIPAVMWVFAIMIVASAFWATRSRTGSEGWTIWLFTTQHDEIYEEPISDWNSRDHDSEATDAIKAEVLSMPVLQQRMLGSFLGNIPIAEFIEVERTIIEATFAGPPDSIGFVDIRDRLERDGLFDAINPPSFLPWSSRGGIYGLPHDVHPVLLAYRADLVEAAGIDITQIETWDDFERVLRPLCEDLNGDGNVDRYLISIWPTMLFDAHLEALLLQADASPIADDGTLRINTPEIANVLATIADWCAGPNRIADDLPEYNASANNQRVAGRIVAAMMPDHLAYVWKRDMPNLAGKMKLMPLPAWQKGGRRTSVWGGTMLGLPESSVSGAGIEERWAFAKHLYLSEESAVSLYRNGDIITPVVGHWDHPVFAEPDPFFSGQPKGLLYIEQASNIPDRQAHPFRMQAIERMFNVLIALQRLDEQGAAGGRDGLRAEAARLLSIEQRRLGRDAARNVFWSESVRRDESAAADSPEYQERGTP